MKTVFHYITITFFTIILTITESTAQENETNDFQNKFNSFRDSITSEFESFNTKNDSIFYSFLRQAWVEFNLSTDKPEREKKPEKQPVSDSIRQKRIEIVPQAKKTNLFIEDKEKNLRTESPEHYDELDTYIGISHPCFNIDFYGTSIDLPIPEDIQGVSKIITGEIIADYFKYACNSEEILQIVNTLKYVALNSELNGYGYLELLIKTSEKLYDDENGRVLFSWFSLVKSGYDVKIGYNREKVYLMVSYDTPVYYSSYFELNNKKYYMANPEIPDNEMTSLKSYKSEYPGDNKELGLKFSKLPNLSPIVKSREIRYNDQLVTLSYDSNLTNYLKNYPECELSTYFPPPLSDVSLASFCNFLNPLLNNKTDIEKIELVLNFIQNSIKYETDNKQFGKENYLFAEETLCYPYADCEDRSVLLAQLLAEFTGMKSIALIFPGHVALGVNINENIDGAFITHNNKRYYIADPTYIGAKLGKLMPKFNNIKPEVIELY